MATIVVNTRPGVFAPTSTTDGFVVYDAAQTLTSGQKAQAQANIGVAGTVVYDAAQTLSGGQQTQAQSNIGVVAASTSVSGLVRLATDAETCAITATDRALTPSNLAGRASFCANKNGTNQTISFDTWTKVTLTTEKWDTGSYYDAANSKWVPPAGKVRLSAHVYAYGTTGTTFLAVKLYKNGSAFSYGGIVTGSGALLLVVAALDNPNGTDYYELYCYVSGTGTATISGSIVETTFEGEQI
jgi:hypothetical protein